MTILERTSEAAWLKQRLGFVTATDIGKLANGGPATWAALRAEKLTGERTFFGNVYTEHGKSREPFILANLEFLYGVTPNNALHVLDGTRYAATPDAIGGGLIGECKTTVKPFGDTPDSIPGNYRDQVQWGIHVTGVDACAFAWELTEGDPVNGLTPGPLTHFLIPRDDKRIAELIEIADRFLAYLEGDESPGEFDDLIGEYLAQQAVVKAEQEALDAIAEQIRERAGDRDVSESRPFGSLSYVLPKPRAAFDQSAFKSAHPDLYAQFMKSTPPAKRTLRVTPRSEK